MMSKEKERHERNIIFDNHNISVNAERTEKVFVEPNFILLPSSSSPLLPPIHRKRKNEKCLLP